MLVTLQKVSQEDVDEICDLFHKLDKTGNGALTVDDLDRRNQQFRASLYVDAPAFLNESSIRLFDTNVD